MNYIYDIFNTIDLIRVHDLFFLIVFSPLALLFLSFSLIVCGAIFYLPIAVMGDFLCIIFNRKDLAERIPYSPSALDKKNETDRGQGGYGSTGR